MTSHFGLHHDYLGIHWDLATAGQISLSMTGYLKDIVSEYYVIMKSKTPATDRLFVTDISGPLLSNTKREEYHSAVMTLHYLAKRIRPDILTKKNRNSRLLGHVSFDGQNNLFFKNGDKNGFISGFGHYFPDFGYLAERCVYIIPDSYGVVLLRICVRSSTNMIIFGKGLKNKVFL